MRVLSIILGVILIIGGVFCIAYPTATFATLGWLVGILLLISGINGIAAYVTGRKSGGATVWDLVFGILTVVLGVFLLFSPLAVGITDIVLVYLFSIWMVVGGILRIVAGVGVIRKHTGSKAWIWMLILGILMILLGIFGFFFPLVNALAMGWMMGFFIIFQGFNLIAMGSVYKGGSMNTMS